MFSFEGQEDQSVLNKEALAKLPAAASCFFGGLGRDEAFVPPSLRSGGQPADGASISGGSTVGTSVGGGSETESRLRIL